MSYQDYGSAGGAQPPQFGYTVDDGVAPRTHVPRPAVVWLGMVAVALVVALGVAGVITWDLAFDSFRLRLLSASLSSPGLMVIMGFVAMEVLLWRGKREVRVLVPLCLAAGFLFEVAAVALIVSDAEHTIWLGYLMAMLLIAGWQVAAAVVAVIVVRRRDVTEWTRHLAQQRSMTRWRKRHGYH
ncbi:MAG: hypothetical protein ACRD0P_21215 [Stackebrandtia sp.]